MGLENSVGPYSMGHECENKLVLTGRKKKTNESTNWREKENQ